MLTNVKYCSDIRLRLSFFRLLNAPISCKKHISSSLSIAQLLDRFLTKSKTALRPIFFFFPCNALINWRGEKNPWVVTCFRSVSPLDPVKMHGCTNIYFDRSTLFLVLAYLPLHLLKNISLSIAISRSFPYFYLLMDSPDHLAERRWKCFFSFWNRRLQKAKNIYRYGQTTALRNTYGMSVYFSDPLKF